MYQSCPRCHGALPTIDTTPVFCPHCGLPQLRVSGDVVANAAVAESNNPATAGLSAGEGALHMPRALRVVAVAGLLGVVPASLLPGALVAGETGGIALLLMPALALGAVFVYSRSRPPTIVSAAGGTRIGTLLGLWMGSLVAAVTGIAGFVLRYRYHSHAMDDKIEQAAAQMPTQLKMAGSPPPPELLAFLQTPEFRAGTFIFGHVFTLLLLVAAGSVCGWMAATVLRARRQRTID